jgi:GAF domain-containing protein
MSRSGGMLETKRRVAVMERNWSTFIAALAAEEQPRATLLALQALFRQQVGAKLFTVMTFDAATGLSQRVHSSHPNDYPVSGVKPLSVGLWSRTVIDERRIFVANSIEAIAEVFPDHELIRSLGCESVVNLPVVFAGAVIGTVNLLDAPGYYTQGRIARVEDLSPFAAAALLAARAAAGAKDVGI